MYPAKFPGLGEALIFFCLLFFHQGKAPAGAAEQGPYAIRPYIWVPVKKTPPKFIAVNH